MYDRCSTWLCGFDGDKYVHFIACQLIAFLVARLLSVFVRKELAAAIGVVVAIVGGVLKEYVKDDSVDKDDIRADIAGAITGGLQSLI